MTKFLPKCFRDYDFLLGVEWTLYEQVAIAALDCQAIDVAKVQFTLL